MALQPDKAVFAAMIIQGGLVTFKIGMTQFPVRRWSHPDRGVLVHLFLWQHHYLAHVAASSDRFHLLSLICALVVSLM